MPTGKPKKKYDGEFKLQVVETMEKEHLSLRGTARQFKIGDHHIVAKWERYYLKEGKGEVKEVAPNLVEGHFKTNEPNRKWVIAVTEFKVNDQKLYLSPIIDLFNREVVSYNLSRHPNFKQVTDMLKDAFQKLPDKEDDLILHSDQGWQYQMKTYQRMLKAKGITQSMSRKATCLDNAVAENFFGLLKTELLYLEKSNSIDQLERAIVEYIDYYNNLRIKLKLNGLSPVQYRIQTVRVA